MLCSQPIIKEHSVQHFTFSEFDACLFVTWSTVLFCVEEGFVVFIINHQDETTWQLCSDCFNRSERDVFIFLSKTCLGFCLKLTLFLMKGPQFLSIW